MEQSSPKVKSADRVLDIFELYTGEKDSYTLTEIAKSLNMPASSAYQILQNMLSRGYLESDSTGKHFRLGYKLFEIRVQHRKSTSLTAEFFHIAGKMAEQLNEVVMLGVRSEDKVVYIADKQIAQPFRVSTSLGSVLPLHASASGKILLSRLSEEELSSIYPKKKLKAFTSKTITSLDALKAELVKVREEEIAYNLGESVEGVHCMAGPIYDMEGNVVASISVSIPVIRITDELWENTRFWITKACKEISNKVYLQN
ncbi:IclR family transcriptional regulator [Paenibacillus thermotolerans]|uniref:IclR family transcriptional regulator n=1 Tax=Paenibacillus thermotolerans TaxID=3027807 RepID=UPI0023680833|nr:MULTISPECIES: IclR family transcriptional regulator [unclassified Paenibacillus]